MARYQVILAYDGSDFQGFQRQGKTRTVQVEVENALRALGWKESSILSAGRTDAGVHATGQVVSFELDWEHTDEALVRAMNANLPFDVAVSAARQTRDAFHPRFDASSRSYRYLLYCAPQRNPLRERYAWRVWPPVRLEPLQSAAEQLVGTHDFSAFGRAMKPGGSTVRTVFRAGWKPLEEDAFVFEVSANAFLYHMVRRMVYLQVQVGQERVSLDEFTQGVCSAKALKPGLAEPNGLTLVDVHYDEFPGQERRIEPGLDGGEDA